METVKFIRHFFKQKRIASEKSDIFFPKPDGSIPYQDVISFSQLDHENFLVYTMGKHIFPQNYDMRISMSRWMLIFVTEGSIRCGTQLLEAGDFFVLPPSCTHTITTKKEFVSFYWCTLNDSSLINSLISSGYRDSEAMFGHTDQAHAINELFEQTIYNFPKHCDNKMYIVGRLTCLLSYITTGDMKREGYSDQMFKRCLDMIEGRQGNITVDSLAKHLFVSRRYLYTLFKKYKNISPLEYIHAVRMKSADKYLTSTDLPISEIAEIVGYSNYSHFTRAYKKYFFISPSKRRSQAKVQSLAYYNPPEIDKDKFEISFDE